MLLAAHTNHTALHVCDSLINVPRPLRYTIT